MTHPLFYTGRHGGASLSSAPAQRVTAVAVSLRSFLRLHSGLPGEIREEVRLPQAGRRGRGQQVPRLRGSHQGLRAHLLRKLQEIHAPAVLVQGPLVLPVMPREEGLALRRVHYRHNRLPGAAPPVRLQPAHHAAGLLPQ